MKVMTVSDQLPDQVALRASQEKGPSVKEEASWRPTIWSAEELVVDDACETSFETVSEEGRKAKMSQPLGRIGSNGSLDNKVAETDEQDDTVPDCRILAYASQEASVPAARQSLPITSVAGRVQAKAVPEGQSVKSSEVSRAIDIRNDTCPGAFADLPSSIPH